VANTPETSILSYLRNARFAVLLFLLGSLMLAAPFIGAVDIRGKSGLAEISLGILFVSMLMSAAHASARSRVSMIVAWCLLAPLIVIWILDIVTGPNTIAVVRHIVGLAYVGYVILLIFRYLFATVRVTVNTIAASLCIYFLLAIVWAEIYSIMEIADPGSFLITGADSKDVLLELGGEGTALSLYYSLVTLTTLGYGDIVPKTAPARMFAAMEAVTGQMYLAVLVARLVGMHIAHSRDNSPRPDNEDDGR
jgi:hypothetical protein